MDQGWVVWALGSAFFAGLTAILAKLGVAQINSDLATFIRTLVVVGLLAAILAMGGQWRGFSAISGRSYLFLILSGLATGASWFCYFRALKIGEAAKVAPIDKLSVVFVALIGVAFLGEKLSPINWAGLALLVGGALMLAYGG